MEREKKENPKRGPGGVGGPRGGEERQFSSSAPRSSRLSRGWRRRAREVVVLWVPTFVPGCCVFGNALRLRTRAEYWDRSSIGRSFFKGFLLERIGFTGLAAGALAGKSQLVEKPLALPH